MVMPSPIPMRTKKTKGLGVPTIDLSLNTSTVSEQLVRACEEFGFFKVINHGVDKRVISAFEQGGVEFFSKPAAEKQRAGPANPCGYGYKSIGNKGDTGELEYLLLHTNPISISEKSQVISNDPETFRCVVKDYVDGVRDLACEILELTAEGLWMEDKYVLSRMIRDVHSDSFLRLNHYPTVKDVQDSDPSPQMVGFGEHSDPQILTILRSNDVPGLQICLQDGLWVAVPADPTAFYIIIGDAFQVFTNERFTSLRHRALTNSSEARMSMMFFAGPSLNTWIQPLPEMVSLGNPSLYKSFTWGEFKEAAYSLRLGDARLDHFKTTY